MLPRPRFRLPLWAAAAIVAGAYLVRAVMRGMDFRLDWPADAVALGMFALVVVMVAYVRNVLGGDTAEKGDAATSPHPEHSEGPPAP
ncbi:MAG: hypothetical protein P4L93_01975 [Coriobacteriia bacterium]|nr:hypothetical protein [Coriobacteriia bacterium]